MKYRFLFAFLYIFPLVANADAIEINGIYYNLVSKNKIAEVTSNPHKYSGDVIIPESITYNKETYTVSVIGQFAFFECEEMKSIFIPKSIKEIQGGAFNWCPGLNAIHISDLEAWLNIFFQSNPLSEAHHLFLNGEEVTEVTIPESISAIKDCVFSGCTSLTSLKISNSVNSMGTSAFANCTGLTSVSIPNSVTKISSAFYGCKGLETIVLPNGIKDLPSDVFAYCSSLKSIKIPSSVEYIGTAAFENCENLEFVDLSENLLDIGINAFLGCSKLSSIHLSDKITEIRVSTFYGCKNLKTIILGKSLNFIMGDAFADCSNIENVYCYSENVPFVDESAFWGSYIDAAVLHVQEKLIDVYKTTNVWKDFGQIVSLDATENIPLITYDKDVLLLYNLQGKRQNKVRKGLNIIKSGRKVKKLFIK